MTKRAFRDSNDGYYEVDVIDGEPMPTWTESLTPCNLQVCTTTASELWTQYQQAAQAVLDKSDVTVLRCIESGVSISAAWTTYRKALRSIIGAPTGDPTAALPKRPPYPSGT